jgi:general stress protein 26
MRDTHQPGFAKLAAIIEAVNVGMLITEDEGGNLRSRPMATQKVEGDVLWFYTASDAPKVDEIRKAAKVNVSYADPTSQTYVSVSGAAQTIRDAAKVREFWSADAARWFPDGPGDPRLALLKVQMNQAEYWDVDTQSMKQLLESGATSEEVIAATEHKKLA